ncbi:MAG: hypothetical protein BJ554DRAFT_7009 [Olpidium bornovanus]|uniref:Tr-type G domain-containing protein n=1 Tax=Olpidium bornovanus TaxID=278681 RepID=A0A8H7ZXC3_9FUNG|nr:MAG: hypothetical protein BJ554DRAFT_7009 [Olpidium bornovanus]
MGFSASNEPINYSTPYVTNWPDILARSHHVVSFLDTCGHPSYQHTTLRSLLPRPPDYACLVLSATVGCVSAVAREHFLVSVGLLGLPTIVVITKTDMASTAQLRATLEDFMSVWKGGSAGLGGLPFVVKEDKDVTKAVDGLVDGSLVPIFLTSSVSGERLGLLQALIGQLPKPPAGGEHHKRFLSLVSDHGPTFPPFDVNASPAVERVLTAAEADPADDFTQRWTGTEGEEFVAFQIEEVYSLPDAGDVVAGTLLRGQIRARDALANAEWDALTTFHLGPDRQGRMHPVQVASIHRHRRPVAVICPGQTATLALRWPREGVAEVGESDSSYHISRPLVRLRKGMVLLGSAWDSSVHMEFMAEVAVVHRASSLPSSGTAEVLLSPELARSRLDKFALRTGHEVTVHCGSVCQNASVVSVTKLNPLPDAGHLPDAASDRPPSAEASAEGAVEDGHAAHTPQLFHPERNHCLRTGERGLLRLRFCKEMEFLRVDSPVLCRYGECLAVGRIVRR